jgi:hypothetical protein
MAGILTVMTADTMPQRSASASYAGSAYMQGGRPSFHVPAHSRLQTRKHHPDLPVHRPAASVCRPGKPHRKPQTSPSLEGSPQHFSPVTRKPSPRRARMRIDG